MTMHTNNDLSYVLKRTPKWVKDLLKDSPFFIAGGFIRSIVADETPNDIDIFGGNKQLMEQALTEKRYLTTENAFTVLDGAIPVQFIHKWQFPDIDHCLDHFDFTVARAAIYYRNNQWWSQIDPHFYADVAAKRLTYTGNGDAAGSILRMMKFLRNGYRMAPEQLSHLLARFYAGIREQSRVPDAAVICGLIREIDPLNTEVL